VAYTFKGNGFYDVKTKFRSTDTAAHYTVNMIIPETISLQQNKFNEITQSSNLDNITFKVLKITKVDFCSEGR